jgi:hypothetical protein
MVRASGAYFIRTAYVLPAIGKSPKKPTTPVIQERQPGAANSDGIRPVAPRRGLATRGHYRWWVSCFLLRIRTTLSRSEQPIFFTQQDIGGDYTDSIIALEHDSLVNPTQNPEEPKIPRSASRGLFRSRCILTNRVPPCFRRVVNL